MPICSFPSKGEVYPVVDKPLPYAILRSDEDHEEDRGGCRE
jgi:hypothetical protein